MIYTNITNRVTDSDTVFIIDPITRKIEATSDKLQLMQYDHDSEMYTFQVPRFIEGYDVSLCNKIEILYSNIDRKTKKSFDDIYQITDVSVDEELVTFEWLVSGFATRFAGSLNFLIRFAFAEEDSTYSYLWHTDIFKGITILEGMNNSEAIVKQNPDIIDEFQKDVADLQQVTDELKGDLAQIEDAVQNTLSEQITSTQSELIDIRTAADGTTYGTAGEAVRAQVNELKAVDDELKSDLNELQIPLAVSDMANSWWCNPRAIYSQLTDMTYVTGVTSQGLCGIGIFDNKFKKTHFVRLSYTYKDDHNAPAILVENDKPPIVAYTGHSQYNYVRVRVGDAPYDVKSLENKNDTEISFENGDYKCTYASLMRISNTSKVVLFTRVGQAIFYRVSNDWGNTWNPQKRFVYPYYYMTFKISTDGYAKIAISKHPITHHSTGIYYFRLRLSDGALVGRSGADLGNILSDSFDGIDLDNNTNVIKVHVTNWEQDTTGARLLDIGNTAQILAVKLDYTNPSVGGTYGVYKSSSQDGWVWAPIVSTGVPVGYKQSAYIGGACFNHISVGDASVILTREENGTWYTEEWRSDGSEWKKYKTIEETNVKTGRPQVPWGDFNHKLALINYRYYDDTDFTIYFGDEKLVSF